jgi:hypothetical protein
MDILPPRYLWTIPARVPDGWVAVRNRVRPTRRLGSRGLRAWLAQPDAPWLDVCACGWAPELGEHFRIDFAAAAAAKGSPGE